MGRRELDYKAPKQLVFKPKEGRTFILMFSKGKFTKETKEILKEIGRLRSNDQATEEANGLAKIEPKNMNISYFLTQRDIDSGSTNRFEKGLNQETESSNNILPDEGFTPQMNNDYIWNVFGYDDLGLYDAEFYDN